MAGDTNPPNSFSTGRKWGIFLSVILSMAAVISLVVMINYLAERHLHTFRFNLSRRTEMTLSPQTLGLLRSLTNRVKVTIYYDKDDPLYPSISALLDEYRFASRQIAVETVDYQRDPAAAQRVKESYHLNSPEDRDMVIFDSDGRYLPIPGKTLGKYQLEPVPGGTERQFANKLKAFQGELYFSSALLSVSRPKPMKAYFLQRHGEHNPDSESNTGYSKFKEVLSQKYVTCELLQLLGTNTVPADCNLLIIAGPQAPFLQEEVTKIKQYLLEGGRMLLLFNPATREIDTGLEPILAAQWEVGVGHNVVRDPNNSRSGTGYDVVVSDLDRHHPVVNSLLGSSIMMFYPRSIASMNDGKDAPGEPTVVELARTSPQPYLDQSQVPLNHPLPLMVAVEQPVAKNVLTARGETRMIVAGDSLFLDNQAIEAEENRSFAGNAVSWLLNQTELLQGIGPRAVTEFKFQLTRSQMHSVEWIFLGGMPGAVLLVGGLVWLRRRH